jgi:hypothetical protein
MRLSSRPAKRGGGTARRAVGGASDSRSPRSQSAQPPHAPSTTLRVVPLPRFVSLRGGGSSLVIARSNATKAIQLPAQARWIASLPLAMTSKRHRLRLATLSFATLTIVTTGLDPVVHADAPRIKQLGESQRAEAPHGLPGKARQRRREGLPCPHLVIARSDSFILPREAGKGDRA